MTMQGSTEASAVRIRPGTIDDNQPCAAVLVDAINDLGRRNGSIEEGGALEHETPFGRFDRYLFCGSALIL